jgi:hypothetical protein
MKQTAVEWLVEQILTEVQNYEDGDIENEWEEPFKHEYVNKYIGMIDLSEFVIKAKEIEKEQMKNLFKAGHLYSGCPFGLEQYYNETFNK